MMNTMEAASHTTPASQTNGRPIDPAGTDAPADTRFASHTPTSDVSDATGMSDASNTPGAWLRRTWFVFLPLAVYLATYLVTFPGMDSPDAGDQRAQYATWTFYKQHSVLDTFFLGFVARNQLWLSNLLQLLIMSACVITALVVLSRRISRRWLIAATLVWTFYPLFPAYAVSCTKDVLCAAFILLLCVELFEIIDSRGAMLARPWFAVGFGLTCFLVNELRKNDFLFLIMIAVFLVVRYRKQWRRLLVPLLVFAVLTGGWRFTTDHVLEATPSPTTEMLGVPLMQVGYIYYTDLNVTPQHISSQADSYFQSLRPAEQWANNYATENLVVMSNKLPQLTGDDLSEFLTNWADLCFSNLGTCVKAYVLFEGSLVNPLQRTDDQYSIAAGVTGLNKVQVSQIPAYAIPARIVFNLAILDWMIAALAILAVRRGRRELLPLFLIPLGILLSVMLAALAVQVRLMLGAIILIPFLAGLVLGRPANDHDTARDDAN